MFFIEIVEMLNLFYNVGNILIDFFFIQFYINIKYEILQYLGTNNKSLLPTPERHYKQIDGTFM